MAGSDQGQEEQIARRRTAVLTYRWLVAIMDAHNKGDLAPLIALLRSDVEMVPVARDALAALLERRTLKKKRGRPTTPLFRMSREHYLALAAETAKGLEAGTTAIFGEPFIKMSRDDAIKRAASHHELRVKTLRTHMDGRRGSSNRRKRRLRANPSRAG